MTDRSSGQGRANDWTRGYSGETYAGEQYSGESYPDETFYGQRAADQGMPGAGMTGQGVPAPGMAEPGTAGPGMAGPGTPTAPFSHSLPRQAADSRSFLNALFDFSFTSFVTTRIIRVLYRLILVLTVLWALGVTVWAFRVSGGFGLVTLIVGDPLFIIIVMAFWRLVLESFVVVFRIAEDTRAMRERGEIPSYEMTPDR